MSADTEAIEIDKRPRKERRKEAHERKRKEKEEGKQSKKRKREEHGSPQPLAATEPSPTKEPRTDVFAESKTDTIGVPPSDDLNDSPFAVQTCSLYLPLSPISQLAPLDGICAEHLSPLILTYYQPLKGVILSYDNVRLSASPDGAPTDEAVLAETIAEYGASYVWVTADFTLLRPTRGVVMDAWINLQSESHLGLVCWNLFNASIERKRLPKDWKWREGGGTAKVRRRRSQTSSQGQNEEEEGYYVDSRQKKIEGAIRFTAQDFESFPAAGRDREKGFISIQGTLLSKEEEKQLKKHQKREAKKELKRHDRLKAKRLKAIAKS